MSLIVRPATVADVEAVFELALGLATSFRPEREPFEISFANLLELESAYFLVAEVDAQVVGYCLGFDHLTFYANGRVAWVEEVMVQEDMREQGIGRALMEAFENWAIAREAKLVALATRRAAAFYRALGYEDSATYFRKLL